MATFGIDVPLERPRPGARAVLFVPHAEADEAVSTLLRNGSGMAGFGNRDGTLTIYFENNKFNEAALHAWQNKVFKAYDRMVNGSPTVNKLTCDAGNLVTVGIIAGSEILVHEMATLRAWLERSGALDSMPPEPHIHP